MRKSKKLFSEINVTPLVDVMLVLLVVFMITAPLLTMGVPLDLPQSKAGAIGEKQEPLLISINRNGEIYLQTTKVAAKFLIARLKAVSKGNQQARVFVRADKSLDYGAVIRVLGDLRAAGFERVALITETDSKGPKI